MANLGYQVSLVVADGEGNETVEGVAVYDVGCLQGRLNRMFRTTWRIYKRAKVLDAHVLHLHDPELLLVGMLLKMSGKQVIYDVHEDYSRQILHKSWVPVRLRRVVSWVTRTAEALAVSFIDRAVAVTPEIAAKFPKNKVALVRNYPVLEEYPLAEFTPFASRANMFVYVGGLTELRGSREMCHAIKLLPAATDVKLVLAGDFIPATLQHEVLDGAETSRLDYRGFVDRIAVAQILGQGKAGLVILHPVANYIESLPIKMFEYMAAGLPVIASDFPRWREIIQEHDCGLFVDPMNPVEIANAMQWVIDHPVEAEAMGLRGRKAVENNYRWDIEEKTLLEVYRDIA